MKRSSRIKKNSRKCRQKNRKFGKYRSILVLLFLYNKDMNKKELMLEMNKVAEMENIFNRLETIVSDLEKQTVMLNKNKEQWDKLFSWYFEGSWLQDHDLDETGVFSKKMSCGVLSEDGIYDLYCRLEQLRKDWERFSAFGKGSQNP